MGMTKIGNVWSSKKDPNKFSIKLGQESDNAKYNFSVEVIVKDGNGNVVAQQKDGFLTLKDPRQGDFLSEEKKAKVPATLQFDILIPNLN